MHPIILTVSDHSDIQPYIQTYAQSHSISPSHIFFIEPEKKQIRIDQIRMIKKHLIHVQSHARLMVINQFHTATKEAQNAFLKTLEEHSSSVHFILVVQNVHTILPTVVSRCRLVQLDKHTDKSSSPDKLPIGDLFAKKDVLAVLSDKTLSVKTTDQALMIIDSCIAYARSRLITDTGKAAQFLKKALELRSLLIRNNTNPQLSLDMLMFEFCRIYQK